jgi:hypothetical protein
MSLKDEDVRKWDSETLLREYEQRRDILPQLGGWLYSSIVAGEIQVIKEVASERTEVPLDHWRLENLIPSSWTDPQGLVHWWKGPNECLYNKSPKADSPMKMPTCLLCVVRR